MWRSRYEKYIHVQNMANGKHTYMKGVQTCIEKGIERCIEVGPSGYYLLGS